MTYQDLDNQWSVDIMSVDRYKDECYEVMVF